MKALVFDLSIPKYLLARVAGPRRRRLHYGAASCFHLRDITPPTRPDGAWGTLAPVLVGLCGTDLGTIFFKLSPAMSALSSTPCVLGHEILAKLAATPDRKLDATGRALAEGDRVVIDPFIGCAARGIPEDSACASCIIGAYATCERAGLGPRKGVMLGAGRELPGGFAERSIAHESQLFRVDGRIRDDRAAVLVEPLAVAVQAMSTHAPREGRALVIGGGPIGLAVVWALRRLAPNVEVTLVSLEDYQLDLARRLGATHALAPPHDQDVLEALALHVGSPILRPILGRPFLAGGFDLVVDCVGIPSTLDDALRSTRPRGTLVIAGCQGVVPKIDLTFVWSRELRIVGTCAYGWCNDLEGERRRTFDVTIDLIADDEALLAPLVTHSFSIDRYREAIEVSVDRRASKSVKAVIRPSSAP